MEPAICFWPDEERGFGELKSAVFIAAFEFFEPSMEIERGIGAFIEREDFDFAFHGSNCDEGKFQFIRLFPGGLGKRFTLHARLS